MTKEIVSREKMRSSFKNMKKRCNDTENKDYKYYGGRGIKVCDRWSDSNHIKVRRGGGRPSTRGFENFVEDMGQTWFPGATIDRIDNDGDYTPENCQWLSMSDNLKKEYTSLLETGKHIFQRSNFQRDANLKRSASGKPPGFKKGTTAVYDLLDKRYTRVLSAEYQKNKETRYINPAVAKKRGF